MEGTWRFFKSEERGTERRMSTHRQRKEGDAQALPTEVVFKPDHHLVVDVNGWRVMRMVGDDTCSAWRVVDKK